MKKLTGAYTFLTEGLIIRAVLINGQLMEAKGEKVKSIEPIEMDVVLVHHRNGYVEPIELGEFVRWLPEQEVA